MFTARWQLFRLFGIPISLDASWLVIVALLTWTLSTFFARAVPNLPPVAYWAMGLGTAMAFFACIVLHEMGHALVARRFGMPIRGITLFMFGGVAELGGEPVSAGREFFMAIAGPIVSAVLAALFAVLAVVGSQVDWHQAVVYMLGYLASINTVVLVFNLIPAFPLDGGRVFRSAVWAATGNLRRATYWASLVGQAFAWLLIAVGVMRFFAGDVIGGMWLGLIGLFLNNAARWSYQEVLVRQALQGEPVQHFMNTQPLVVPPSLDLKHWVEEFVFRHHHKMFPVASNGHIEGVVRTRDLSGIPRAEWENHTVGEIMKADVAASSISPRADALEALSQMRRTGLSRLLVLEGDQLVGIVSLKDLLRFLDLKIGLEEQSALE